MDVLYIHICARESVNTYNMHCSHSRQDSCLQGFDGSQIAQFYTSVYEVCIINARANNKCMGNKYDKNKDFIFIQY